MVNDFWCLPHPFDMPFVVLVDEETGQDRFMRGLAKMRELDLRLARTTERARELKLMAQDAAEQAAAGMFTTGNEVQTVFWRTARSYVEGRNIAKARCSSYCTCSAAYLSAFGHRRCTFSLPPSPTTEFS